MLSILLVPWAPWAGTVLRTAGGGVVGLVAGTGATLGVVVGRARFDEHFMESTRDLVGLPGAPMPVGVAAGGLAGWLGSAPLVGAGAGALVGGAAGVAVGVLAGAAMSDEPEDRWAGGVVGAGIGLWCGLLVGGLAGARRGRRGQATALLVAMLAMTACEEAPVPAEPVAGAPVPADAAPAEAVVFLVGDPGKKARYRHYPIIPRVAAEVEAWAQRIGRDSAVTVLVLGDIVYPDGMHDPGTPGYATDSARVSEQVEMVRAPGALRRDARLYFLAGNHDWGFEVDAEGSRRLRNLGSFLDRVRERGANVDLMPPAGSGIPGTVDLGPHIRLILLDTAWWLFDAEPEGKEAA
ncbi:MAG: hypothetical protein GWM90_13080, partial [Gemmatimonadetes bacterium]|nr:hypothetical protein [Gemmatimonadota bacterium]NIQ54998.1 hypothetical protein [Gemmatimonadota bacterium]NIU75194.1 hypothetical protein [Gammaproteobacteria bacterium]NIX45009.1 hypothetical protein [Gemmatimonadota bacterium]NIY09237.1 hypothetical protein [Gemmatimonadota bacterium]